MAVRSVTRLQFQRNRELSLGLQSEAAMVEGRCQALLDAEAYELAKRCAGYLDKWQYPTPDERVAYWRRIHRNGASGTLALDFRARLVTETRKQWPSGHRETIWKNGKAHAEVVEGGRDGGGELYLEFYNGTPGVRAMKACGVLASEWLFTLTEQHYADWTAQVRRLVR